MHASRGVKTSHPWALIRSSSARYASGGRVGFLSRIEGVPFPYRVAYVRSRYASSGIDDIDVFGHLSNSSYAKARSFFRFVRRGLTTS